LTNHRTALALAEVVFLFHIGVSHFELRVALKSAARPPRGRCTPRPRPFPRHRAQAIRTVAHRRLVPADRVRIQEHGFGVGKADTMLSKVRPGLAGIPGRTHVCMICIHQRDVNDIVSTVQRQASAAALICLAPSAACRVGPSRRSTCPAFRQQRSDRRNKLDRYFHHGRRC
jgi:hypothetical protein